MQTSAAQCSRKCSEVGGGRAGVVALRAGQGGAVASLAPGWGLVLSLADKTGSPWSPLVLVIGGREEPLSRPEPPGRPDCRVALGMAKQLGPESMGTEKLTRPMPLTDRAMRAQPESNRALRPTRSTSPIAVRVTATFTTPSPTEASTEEDLPRKPTAWKTVEA